jgi:hypothetical protein
MSGIKHVAMGSAFHRIALRYNLGPGLNIVVGRAPYLLQLLLIQGLHFHCCQSKHSALIRTDR